MRRPYRYEIQQIISFAILLAFIAFAFTVEARECPDNKNIKDLKALAVVVTPPPVKLGSLK